MRSVHELVNSEFWIVKLPRASSLITLWRCVFFYLIILYGFEFFYWSLFFCNLTLPHDSFSPISRLHLQVLDTVASLARRSQGPDPIQGRYGAKPNGPILPKSWAAALHNDDMRERAPPAAPVRRLASPSSTSCIWGGRPPPLASWK
jgi:hypothetical protein